MHSMTGYGRGTLEIDGRQLTVELKSVNHRFLDVNFRLPRNLMFLEEDARKGRFNPLQSESRGDVWQQNALGLLLGETAAAFEHLPLVKDSKLLRSIVYSGLIAALPEHLRTVLENETEE